MSQIDDERERDICRVTYVGATVNVFLSLFKLAAGILGHSAAMVADAIHSISDFVTDITVVVFVKMASKPSDEEHDFGHGKFETLSSIIIGVILFLVGFGIFYEAIGKINEILFKKSVVQSPSWLALIAALVSIIAKEGLFHYTNAYGKKHESAALVANAWHHRSDSLSSIGSFLGIGGAILFGESWVVLDPLAAVLVSFLIIKTAWDLVIPGINELLESSLPRETEEEILQIVRSNPEVHCPHNLRTRKIGAHKAIEIHIRVNPDMKVLCSHALTKEIEKNLRERFGEGTYIIVHVEPLHYH